ncbi:MULTISPECIES: S1C family serine protease [Peribacillus]|uniref:S1C family serine protease n=1 Tax=Peribacillus TaxID=2675229 RepID=UPI00191149CF|nr:MULTISPECIES: trypsin-like peptidase domain-containing protein [unclassified Peribacillus]MBK5444702.1 trypsin-like peptidase domain-containing protein [Peribacillus sp. TH24]MBK5460593.1 trypsin-like peptidase domain-containing protein [Peribacillus sp. TH27]MBK5482383.1 trypsin-like peptidase domain-containing protein [Peribacillus sp. TH16]MBK5498746.1 trypsin-like peptidase domain-containing protein [Peribacillus sp. TH14]WMX56144.1 trypsin-like peptidase domain-containing protein [Peri
MENYNGDEQVRVKAEPKKGKSLWLTSLVSGTVASIVTSSVFVFGGDFIDAEKNTVTESSQTAGAEQTESVEKNKSINTEKLSTSTDSNERADMVESASKSIVGVVNLQEMQNQNPFQQQSTESETVESGTGSGVIYKKDNGKAYIITNNHVIEGAKEVEISLYDGQKATATVVGADALTDLAVLTIDASVAPEGINFGDSDRMRPGEEVLAIGNPLGLDFSRSVTQGIVSATGRSISVDTSDGEWELDVLQTDAAINPGNSGGALINTAGEVIGINSLKISESGVEGLGFAIPSNDVIPIVTELIENGKITRPYLGVSLANTEELPQYYLQNVPEAAKSGVMVTGIETGSAAANGGLKQQDIIVEIDGTKISTSAELRKHLYTDKKIGDKVKVKVYRGNEEKTLTITLQNS